MVSETMRGIKGYNQCHPDRHLSLISLRTINYHLPFSMASKRKREVSPAPSAAVQEVPGEVSLHRGASETQSEKAHPNPTLRTTPSEKNFIVITDDEEPSVSDSGPTASVSLAGVPEVQPFLGLDKSFKKEQKW